MVARKPQDDSNQILGATVLWLLGFSAGAPAPLEPAFILPSSNRSGPQLGREERR
jgi:hypothetical protein